MIKQGGSSHVLYGKYVTITRIFDYDNQIHQGPVKLFSVTSVFFMKEHERFSHRIINENIK